MVLLALAFPFFAGRGDAHSCFPPPVCTVPYSRVSDSAKSTWYGGGPASCDLRIRETEGFKFLVSLNLENGIEVGLAEFTDFETATLVSFCALQSDLPVETVWSMRDYLEKNCGCS
jgi:hypothetical protein